MKVNVVYAHPAADSYQASLHQRILRTLTARGDEVIDFDLYAMKFDPTMGEAEWRGHEQPLPAPPALRNLTRMGVVTTCGAPWVYNRLLMQDPARKVLLRGLKATCGGLGVKHLYLAQHSIYDISPEAREKFAQKVEQRFARF